MNLRPSAARALAAAAIAATTLVSFSGSLTGTASAATTTDPVKVGLYGSQDPTYDGVYRQSLSLLAIEAAGGTPSAAAITWLTNQQCADGSFEAFRASLATACAAPDSANFAGSDSNSTGMAVQALKAVGQSTAADSAVAWLGTHQNTDGGWAYYPDGVAGNDSDANSTALGLSAYLSTGTTPPTKGGKTPQNFLESIQVGCTGVTAERGAFTYFGTANDYATVQAVLAAAGGFLPVAATAGADDAPSLTCPPAPKAPKAAKAAKVVALVGTTAGDLGAGYLVRQLAANAGVIPDPFNAGAADVGSTANAVIALVAAKHGSSQVQATLTALTSGVEAYAHKSGADVPGALATLTLAAVSGGLNPTTFGGTNLVTRLAATVTTAAASASPTTSVSPTVNPAKPSASVSPAGLAATGSGRSTQFSGALAGLLLLVGTGLIVAVRRSGSATPSRHLR